jgi:hypothetical protein
MKYLYICGFSHGSQNFTNGIIESCNNGKKSRVDKMMGPEVNVLNIL